MIGKDGVPYTTRAAIEADVRASLARHGVDLTGREDALRDWINDRVAIASLRGWLLTDQQFRDMAAGRELRVGDRVRYVGPDRLEQSGTTGAYRSRPHGQEGTITAVAGRSLVFQPDIAAATRAAAEHMDIEVLRLETRDHRLFERIVSPTSASVSPTP